MEPLFLQRRSLFSRLVLVMVATIALLSADRFLNGMQVTRTVFGSIAKPFYQVGAFPKNAWRNFSDGFASRETLQLENARLQASQRILEAKVQKMAALTAENGRLRALLNSSAILEDDNLVVTELVGVSPDIYRHELIIDKGSNDDVSKGQPVLDASGLMGQVTEVYANSARVLLITDDRHQVPVSINRNGLRMVVSGIGQRDTLSITNVSTTADIRVGDLLVSSGLANRFPVGYPVARIDSIEHQGNSPFLKVTAKPLAQLNRSRHLLLVFTPEPE